MTTPTKKFMEKLFEINGGIVFTDFTSLMKEMIDTKRHLGYQIYNYKSPILMYKVKRLYGRAY